MSREAFKRPCLSDRLWKIDLKMDYKNFIEGENIYLRELEINDVNQSYCNWMNDPEVTRYLKKHLGKWTIKELKNYVREVKKSPDVLFWAIISKDEKQHIGNIKLGHLNGIHSFSDIGIIIGEKTFWGKDLATEAVKLVVSYAFNQLNLQKLIAGVNKNNLGSIRLFRKAGFTELEAEEKEFFCDDSYMDSTLLKIVKK
jgi:ribosomal-protein-alanine N-acetyltransferase